MEKSCGGARECVGAEEEGCVCSDRSALIFEDKLALALKELISTSIQGSRSLEERPPLI